jgi:hypothetical protein
MDPFRGKVKAHGRVSKKSSGVFGGNYEKDLPTMNHAALPSHPGSAFQG